VSFLTAQTSKVFAPIAVRCLASGPNLTTSGVGGPLGPLHRVVTVPQWVGEQEKKKDLTAADIKTKVLSAVKAWERFPKDKELTLDSHFINDLGLDSLDHVELIMAMEDEFSFEIPDADAERLMTPRQIYQYICDKEDLYE